MRLSRLQALREEFKYVTGSRDHDICGEEELHRAVLRLRHGLSALCLSGGGIRSAAFCLGIVQALAKARLLGQFHYLSTVSGGGYIGAWLQGLIHHAPGNRVSSVEDDLAGRTGPDPARFLRNYTNYLSPGASLASTDTWTDIALWLRNTLLTWACSRP